MDLDISHIPLAQRRQNIKFRAKRCSANPIPEFVGPLNLFVLQASEKCTLLGKETLFPLSNVVSWWLSLKCPTDVGKKVLSIKVHISKSKYKSNVVNKYSQII